MDSTQKTSQNLFEVYLRLRPPPPGLTQPDRVLNVEKPEDNDASPSHITLNPPSDRRRAIERFGFTRVFEEEASQVDVFNHTDIGPMVEGVLAPQGGEGTDAVVATLGVTGSGKVCISRDHPRPFPDSTDNIADTYDSRIQDSARPCTACLGCSVPLHWRKHARNDLAWIRPRIYPSLRPF